MLGKPTDKKSAIDQMCRPNSNASLIMMLSDFADQTYNERGI
jgi:hypothetical protein